MSHDLADGSTACSDVETIAAYVDNRLDPRARDQVERHAADCEICSALLGGVSSQLHVAEEARAGRQTDRPEVGAGSSGFSGRAWLAIAASLVALTSIALLLMSRGAGTTGPAERSLLAMRTEGGARVIEGRLSEFPYGPFVRQTRSGSPNGSPSPALVAAESAIQNVPPDRDPVNLYVRGIAWLLANDLDASIRDLEAALEKDASNVKFLNALSVASIAVADARGDERQLRRALELAERAISIDSTAVEPRFNKALALEKLGQRDNALGAWRDAARLDRSAWQREIEIRQANLTRGQSNR